MPEQKRGKNEKVVPVHRTRGHPVPGVRRPRRGPLRRAPHDHAHPQQRRSVWTGLLFPTDRLSYNFTPGEHFGYSSRTCAGSAPFNEVGLNFIPNYPGVDDDADQTVAVRHGISGNIVTAGPSRGSLRGTVITELCRPGPSGQVGSEHSIVWHFEAQYLRADNNVLQIYGGFQISPTESTGTFRDMTGGGTVQGRFTCLGHQGNPSAPSCQQLGQYTDFVGHSGDPRLGPGRIQPGIFGSWNDPTITTGSNITA